MLEPDCAVCDDGHLCAPSAREWCGRPRNRWEYRQRTGCVPAVRWSHLPSANTQNLPSAACWEAPGREISARMRNSSIQTTVWK